MPNPVPLASKEEEERRTWVTAHHEVVRLIKDCFGDRFSNNEIFDRLKISRRTGYRALGNDERIGKAPGRKPKITEDTIKNMIGYIEDGHCGEVGNVWKHLAEQFAPDCNPKTVQDAVKKSGFKNYRNHVKLEPLLNQEVNENQLAPQDEQNAQIQQQNQAIQTPVQQYAHSGILDPTFQQNASRELLRQAIGTSPDAHVRTLLWEACTRFHEVEELISSYLYPYVNSTPVNQASATSMHIFGQHTDDTPLTAKRPRIAVCRRCHQSYDRAENTMENRQCLYHKGSPQKTDPTELGTIEDAPHAYTWSCCGGNGLVRGCCRAMHTTKKRRKYGKKRDATEAGLDEGAGAGDGEDPQAEDGPSKMLNNGQQSLLQSSQAETDHRDGTQQYHRQSIDQLSNTPISHRGSLDQPVPSEHKQHSHHNTQQIDHHSHAPQQIPLTPHTHQPFADSPHHLDNSTIDARLQGLHQDMHPNLQQHSLPVSMHHVFDDQIQNYSLAQNTLPHAHHVHTAVNVGAVSSNQGPPEGYRSTPEDYPGQLQMDMKQPHAMQVASHGGHGHAGPQHSHRLEQNGSPQLPLEFQAQFAAVEQLAGQQ